MHQGLVEIFRYNRWANLELIEACRSLTEAQLDARSPGTSGSVRVLLTHIVGAQQTQILRTKRRQHEGELSRASAWPGIEALYALAASTSDELIAIAARDDLDEPVDLPHMGKGYRYPRRFFLAHAAAHGAEHRTEIKVTLGALGIDTPDLDGWPYGAAAGYGQEV
jgi:uncharacterized damage-inducible protein DinB